MKRYLNLLPMAVVISIIAISCEEDGTVSTSLIGTWVETSFTSSGCTDPADNANETCTTNCETIIITETTITAGTDSYTYTKSGNTLNVTIAPSVILVFTYVISGSTLTLTNQDSAADGGCKNVTNYKKQ